MRTFLFPFLAASLTSLTLASELEKAPFTFEQKRDAKFGMLDSTLTHCVLSFLTAESGEEAFALGNTTCYSFYQEIQAKNLRFFKGKSFDIPEVSHFSASDPEVKLILSLKEVEDPAYVLYSLYFDLKLGNRFKKLALPVSKYLIRAFSDPNLKNIRLKEFCESQKVLDNLTVMALELGHVDTNLSIKKLFELNSKVRTKAFKLICGNQHLFWSFKNKLKDYPPHSDQCVGFMAHMIINGVPLIEFFFDESRDENKAKAAMHNFANNRHENNIRHVLYSIFSVNDIPKSEYSRLHAVISDMISVYFVKQDLNRFSSTVFNDIRFGSADTFSDEIEEVAESFYFEPIRFAFLGGKMDLFRYFVSTDIVLDSTLEIESLLPSSLDEDGAFSLIANILENCPYEQVKKLIWESDKFIRKVAETYYCADYRLLSGDRNVFEFEMAADPELKVLGSPDRILLKYAAAGRDHVIESSIRFKDPFVFERFLTDALARRLRLDFCNQNQDNMRLVMENEFLIKKLNEAEIFLNLNSSIIEFVLEHPDNQKLTPILNPNVPLNAIYLLKTDSQFETLAKLVNIRIEEMIQYSLKLYSYSQNTYFNLRRFILYCLKQPNRAELILTSLPASFWIKFKIEFPIEFKEIFQ